MAADSVGLKQCCVEMRKAKLAVQTKAGDKSGHLWVSIKLYDYVIRQYPKENLRGNANWLR